MLLGWDPTGGENSGRAHATLRARVEDRDQAVLAVIERYRALVDEGVSRLESGDQDGLRALVDENFELRKRVFPVSERDRHMVAIARSRGVSAKQCGSGGAILCVGKNQEALDAAEAALQTEGFETLRPTPVSRAGRAS
jgi:glucuronokinase